MMLLFYLIKCDDAILFTEVFLNISFESWMIRGRALTCKYVSIVLRFNPILDWTLSINSAPLKEKVTSWIGIRLG